MSTAPSPESDRKDAENEEVAEGSLDRMVRFGKKVAEVKPAQLGEAQKRLAAAKGAAKRYPRTER